MSPVTVPDKLINQIAKIAGRVYQTPEEFIFELIQERIDHDSAYSETTYLSRSKANKKRLNKAVKEIKSGKYEAHELTDD
ncbi:MAG: hypothetical protein Q3M30_02565 [Candidatus Electrothrix sp. Rat3]|jgi:hypothetical protein|nr:hypothetical protein [Candidatus Electrothrix rattekaaiensis]